MAGSLPGSAAVMPALVIYPSAFNKYKITSVRFWAGWKILFLISRAGEICRIEYGTGEVFLLISLSS